MAEDAPNNDEAHPTLFCPRCEYNLTGLTKNRCPECAQPFDRAKLLLAYASGPQPITLRQLCLQLAWPPAVMATPAFLGLASWLLAMFAFPPAFLFLITWSLMSSGKLARRLDANWRQRGRYPPHHGAMSTRVAALFVFLFLLQIGLGLTAMLLSCWLTDWMGAIV